MFNEVQNEQTNRRNHQCYLCHCVILGNPSNLVNPLQCIGGLMRIRDLYILIVASDKEATSRVFPSWDSAARHIKCFHGCCDMTWQQFQQWLAVNHPNIKVAIQEATMEL